MHIHVHALTHTYHTHNTHMHMHTNGCTRTHTHTHMHAHTHTHTHTTHSHTHMHARTHTHNTHRAVTALRITFHLPAELHSHMEILPKHGLVQGESFFSAQLKFTPKPSIFAECSGYFSTHSGYLEVPVQIEVAEQVREGTDGQTDRQTDCGLRQSVQILVDKLKLILYNRFNSILTVLPVLKWYPNIILTNILTVSCIITVS